MSNKTLQERICNALAARGYVETDQTKSRKYRVFSRPETSGYFFVGKSGALRSGKNVTESISLERSKIRSQLLEG